jgi:hypothetical protein
MSIVIKGLEDVQGQTYKQPTILLAEHVTGFEDIPEGTVAVITRDTVDVLSHVAIRARSQGALVACCSSAAGWDAVHKQLHSAGGAEHPVAVQLDSDGNVTISTWKGELTSAGDQRNGKALHLASPIVSDRWVLHVSTLCAVGDAFASLADCSLADGCYLLTKCCWV